MQMQKTKRIVFIAMFTAISVVLYFIEIPLFNQALKLDFSDLPAAVAAVLFGPWVGVLIELLKNAITLPKDMGEMGYGALVNFIVGSVMVVSISAVVRALLRRSSHPFKAAAVAAPVGVGCMALAGLLVNYFVAPPYFAQVVGFPLTSAALWGFIGLATILNILKPVITCVLLVPVLNAILAHKNTLRA